MLTASASAIAASIAGCLGDGTSEWAMDETLSVASATQYQGPNCDCCDVFADYLQDHLYEELEITVTDDLTAVKEDYGIPTDLRSCHTVELEGYVVEGHIPVEVITSLLEDKPNIEGIALPGMPAGSPGMGGQKNEEWTVYEIRSSGEIGVYQRI